MLLWFIGGYIAAAFLFYARIIMSAQEDTSAEPMAHYDEPREQFLPDEEFGQILRDPEIRPVSWR